MQRYARPLHDEMFEDRPADYYWTAHQSEWATDIEFRDPKRLQAVHLDLVRHGMLCLTNPDIMRFLGHRLNNDDLDPRCSGSPRWWRTAVRSQPRRT
ncbi:MAG: hypothetical protein MUF54_01355 [Polyangiaceae bacterium]|nr:hypothetical protein [Polyangiaceae bacterium]